MSYKGQTIGQLYANKRRFSGTLDQLVRQASNAEASVNEAADKLVRDAEARGAKVTRFMDEIIIEEKSE